MKHVYQTSAFKGIVVAPLRQVSLALVCTLLSSCLWSQLTIKVVGVPGNTPANAELYAAGTFNNWNPADPSKKLMSIGDGRYMLTVNPAPGQVEFKFTRGSWETVEGNLGGQAQPSHKIFYNGQPKTIEVAILSWPDINSGNPTLVGPGQVNILNNDFYIPQLARSRRIWTYLPPSYGVNPGRRYPVLYMQDGQNLFDPTTCAAGEWEIDEAMNALAQGGDPGCIIVGIDNGGSHRTDEYSPWVNPAYGGGEGVDYVNFIVNTLKPYIDNNYNTLSDRDHTGIMGSSMGGLISMYALIEHQATFSKAGIFSPAFWFNGNKSVEHILNTGRLNDVRVFFLAGGQEPPYISNGVEEVVEAMLSVGFDLENIQVSNPSDGQHAEWFWRREFAGAYSWLFENAQAVTDASEVAVNRLEMQVYPNPATDWVRFKGDNMEQLYSVRIMSTDGRLLYDEIQQGNEPVWTGDLPRGAYVVSLTDETGNSDALTLIHE